MIFNYGEVLFFMVKGIRVRRCILFVKVGLGDIFGYYVFDFVFVFILSYENSCRSIIYKFKVKYVIIFKRMKF